MGLMLIFALSSILRAVIFIPKQRGGKWSDHLGCSHLEFLPYLVAWQGWGILLFFALRTIGPDIVSFSFHFKLLQQ